MTENRIDAFFQTLGTLLMIGCIIVGIFIVLAAFA